MVVPASQKYCEDKGNDLFYVQHMVQYLVLKWKMTLTFGTGEPDIRLMEANAAEGALETLSSCSLTLQVGS